MAFATTRPWRVLTVGLAVMSCNSPPAPAQGPGAYPLTRPGVASPTAEVAHDLGTDDGEDILARMRELNSDKYAGPPTTFRPGHAKKAKLDLLKVQSGEGRFSLRLPSGAPVASPTVFNDLVLVSGGFRSRQFYALRTETGVPVWGLDLDDDGPSSAVCEDRVCVWNTESCTIFAVDAATGRQLWGWFLGDPLMSSPTIAKGRVFTAYPAGGNRSGSKPSPPGLSHALISLDLHSGKILWQRWIDGDVMSAPVAAADGLYVATLSGSLYKFDQETGRILAAKATRATSAPVIDSSGVYYTRRVDDPNDRASVKEAIVTVRPAGEVPEGNGMMGGGSSTAGEKEAPYLSPAVQSSSSYHQKSLAHDAANGFSGGAPPWANATKAMANIGYGSVSSLQAFQGSRVLRFGALSMSSMGDEVLCLDAASGDTRWSFKLDGDLKTSGGYLAAPPIAAGDNILVGTLSGKIELLEPDSGKRLETFDVKHPLRSQPVVHAGWIYAGTVDGHVVAINTGDKTITGWPMWGKDAARSGAR